MPFCVEQLKVCWDLCIANENVKSNDWKRDHVKYCEKALSISITDHHKCAFILKMIQVMDVQTNGQRMIQLLEQGLHNAGQELKTMSLFHLSLAQIYLLQGNINEAYQSLSSGNEALSQLLEQCYASKTFSADVNFINDTPTKRKGSRMVIPEDTPIKNVNSSIADKVSPTSTLKQVDNDVFFMKLHHLSLTIVYMVQLGEINQAKSALDQFHEIYHSNRIRHLHSHGMYNWLHGDTIDALYHYFGAVGFFQECGITTKQHIDHGLELCNHLMSHSTSELHYLPMVRLLHLGLNEMLFYWFISNSCFCEAFTLLNEIKQMSVHMQLEDHAFLHEMDFILCIFMGDKNTAESILLKSLQTATNPQKKCEISLKLALFLMRERQFQRASEILRNYIDDAYSSSNLMIKVLILYIESIVDSERGNFEDAKTKLKHIIDLNNEKISSYRINGLSFLSLAEILSKSNDYMEVPKLLVSSLAVSQRSGDMILQLKTLSTLTNVYKEMKDNIMYSKMLSQYFTIKKEYNFKKADLTHTIQQSGLLN